VKGMPLPGDLITAFSAQAGQCFRMVYSEQLQADHCRQLPVWRGNWRDVKGRTWTVEACQEHAPASVLHHLVDPIDNARNMSTELKQERP
jgi:hypothetical protein